MNVWIYTLGCRLNQCESEALAQAFVMAGHSVLPSAEGCPLCIVNTCTVTAKAEQKARRVIRQCSRTPGVGAVIVTGCYAAVSAAALADIGDNVFPVGGPAKSALLQLPAYLSGASDSEAGERVRSFCTGLPASSDPFAFAATDFTFHSRAYLKVQDGCDNHCFYCRVRIARGKSVSLDRTEAVSRALALQAAGYHEIVLTGCNLTMYGLPGQGLAGLVGDLLGALGPDMRLRFSSMEPDHIDPPLINLLRDKRIQPYFHIPIQSGSDTVLRRVNRHYTAAEALRIIGDLRRVRPEAFFACDVIAGLPGEDDEAFEETKAFVEKSRFAHMHVFPFSPRPDTELYRAKDRPPESVRDARAEQLRQLSQRMHAEYLASCSGTQAEVILESRLEGNLWKALSGNYIEVVLDDGPGMHRGDLVKVRFPHLSGKEETIKVSRV